MAINLWDVTETIYTIIFGHVNVFLLQLFDIITNNYKYGWLLLVYLCWSLTLWQESLIPIGIVRILIADLFYYGMMIGCRLRFQLKAVCSLRPRSIALVNVRNSLNEYPKHIWWRKEEGESNPGPPSIRPGPYPCCHRGFPVWLLGRSWPAHASPQRFRLFRSTQNPFYQKGKKLTLST